MHGIAESRHAALRLTETMKMESLGQMTKLVLFILRAVQFIHDHREIRYMLFRDLNGSPGTISDGPGGTPFFALAIARAAPSVAIASPYVNPGTWPTAPL
jgi:hypothetical protein